MRASPSRPRLWALALAFGSLVEAAPGLVIYRFGGEALPPPPELGSQGVEFNQVGWGDLDPAQRGAAIDLDLGEAAIGALQRDPTFNIAPTLPDEGGSYVRPNVNGQVWDGDTGTAWLAGRYLCAEFDVNNYFLRCVDDFGTPGTANVNLGGLYQLDRVRIISGLTNSSRIVQAVRVFMADKMPQTTIYHHPPPYQPWQVEVRDNREQVLEIPIPPHDKVGFLQLALGEHNEDWEVHEIEVYAKGYVDRSTYESNVIDFGRPMAWGDLRWSGSRGSQSQVLIQTRSGEDEDPLVYWRYTGRGTEKEEVSRAAYGGLSVGEKAGTSYDQSHWTFWSSPYGFGDSLGAAVVSLSPRRYFQFKVDFLPAGDEGGEVGYLELRASEPLASNLVGEVWPVEVGAGEESGFTYMVRPTIQGGEGGFDRLELVSSSLFSRVSGVRVGDVGVPYTVEELSPHRLVVGFPRLDASDSGALVEVEFSAQVLRYGTTFSGRVWDSGRPLEVPQGVNAGDATGTYEGNGVSVATGVGEEALLSVVSVGGVVTPNGDGVNDEVEISYEVLEVTAPAQVEVEMRDLSGRLVRRLYRGEDGIGYYPRRWDGRDEGGGLVSPGVYVYRVFLDADQGQVEKLGLLTVVY